MSTISELFSAVSIRHGGAAPWGAPVPSKNPGIYVVALSPDPSRSEPVLKVALFDSDAIKGWLSRATELRIDNDPNPTPNVLMHRLRRYWLADENILYIGQSNRPGLNRRTGQLYIHKLGDRKPHRGGHWIRTLSILEDLFVHYAESPNPEQIKNRLIEKFAAGVSSRSKAQVGRGDHAFPFANLELKNPLRRKKHGLRRQAAPNHRKNCR